MKEVALQMGENIIPLELGAGASSICFDRNVQGRLCLVMARMRLTQFSNMFQMQMLVLHLGPPWVTYFCRITNLDD